jgi:NADPH-dependent curcumin reductase CurA
VVESKAPGFSAGDLVFADTGWQDYAALPGKRLVKVPKIEPMTRLLSVYGIAGLTAYFGLLNIANPKAGETVVVSAAAGSVGSIVGQIAKIKGCRAVGIAGGPEKCAYLKELGFDAAIDYKAGDVAAALREHCPYGINVYFDNVGGEILDACLARLAMRARVVICGAISQYNATGRVAGPANYLSLLVHRASMTGMVVFDYAARYPEAITEMAGWMAAGKLLSKEDIVRGLETFPATLNKLFAGENHGKLIIEV